MADVRREEKEWEANDPTVGANTTAQDELIETEPGTPIEKDAEKDSSSEADDKKVHQDVIRQVMSTRSVATSNNPESMIDAQPVKRSWNPLKWNPPPVPKERQVSREYTAGRLSRLVFQWMQPLMTVRPVPRHMIC
jgi:ATP-binding cassette, subfamily C (CFTR/MRP), member 1